ncbi:hypothetical protein A3K24_02950 [candidate division Kazan bacterium RIFCSPHIGHO2_01_FULL_44_14]|uniref:Uncharacterized protein n=1 Tax=candidate division Kazan bacterium RIFCSPLOWO2_01_FULL_45_19 TaxID=1798538 RepID=A0A1F4NQL8_UNCK3|nr:MAG: hypothetical protein A3K51_02950 [candidate division Kazan bacterium RIFCSPLOWO2_01_FULL_45_19]OGB78008.1 MAG: hypothetical protein A3K24_02950 [candidate division Kazan bacterium RIFCSPHIGHO2_01_FULL_44_14]
MPALLRKALRAGNANFPAVFKENGSHFAKQKWRGQTCWTKQVILRLDPPTGGLNLLDGSY